MSMMYLGKGMVYTSQSKSRPGKIHITILNPETGHTYCTCEGFQNHRKCWHTTELEPKTDEIDFTVVL